MRCLISREDEEVDKEEKRTQKKKVRRAENEDETALPGQMIMIIKMIFFKPKVKELVIEDHN